MGSPAENRVVYRFEPYEVDTARGELRKFGNRIRLERKPWLLLLVLLEKRGAVVTRGELQAALWPDGSFVDFEHGLYVAVKKLRAALCDSLDSPRFIETVAREGYRFIAPIEAALPADLGSGFAHGQPPAASRAEIAQPQSAPLKQEAQPSIALPAAAQSWLQRRKLQVALAALLGIALLLVTAARLGLPPPPPGLGPTPAGRIMLVVLPLQNLTGDSNQEYLSDGVTEELTARLGNLNPKQFGVIGRTSAMTYKHSPRSISQIGNELGVSYVLEGSVRRNGNKFRVTAQLVEVAGQTHVWAKDYDRDLRDLFKVEDEVASDIAQQVGILTAPGQPVKTLHPHIPNPEAHEAYLIARYYWHKRTPEGWAKSAEYFRRAVDHDPQYAAAYAGLAECMGPVSSQESLAAAREAVQLDPGSGEAWAALGWVELLREWNLAAAQDALMRAIQLDPNYAPAHHTYSGVLELAGRRQEALDEDKEASLLDPLALVFRASLAEGLSRAGRHDQAMVQIQLLLAIDPHYPKAHETLGNLYLRKGMYKEAIREYEASDRYGGTPATGLLGYAYARSGDKGKALKILSELEALDKKSPSGSVSFDLATVETGLGNRDAALMWLEKEYKQHDDDGPWEAKVDPIYAPLQSDPRFQELMRRL